MKEFGGWYFPDGEEHLPDWMTKVGKSVDGRLAYQYHKLEAALQHVKLFRRAIDIGSHVGLWAFYIAKHFEHVECFEPVPAHRECWLKNGIAPNATLHPYALGDHAGPISLHTGVSSSGDTYVKAGGEHPAKMEMLDSFDFADVDFIKIDCEGFEQKVLEGGEETIRCYKPCIIVEQKPRKASQFGLDDTGAVKLLESWGASVQHVLSGDFILSWS